MTRALAAILRGGHCTRWHANPDLAHVRETLAEHHARVAQIILALHPAPSVALLDAALHHDAGEPAVGDLPAPFKRDNPNCAALHAEAEDQARQALGIDIDLPEDDARWLALADRLAAFAHVAQVAPHLLADPEWQDEARRVQAAAAVLGAGCLSAVAVLLVRWQTRPRGLLARFLHLAGAVG